MKILVTGGSGMIGETLKDIVRYNNPDEWIFLSSKDCDLRIRDDVDKLFERIRPEQVIHLAANVGGLYKNMNNPIDMFSDSLTLSLFTNSVIISLLLYLLEF